MRICVFGALGNVGRRVVAEALSRGHEVRAVVRDQGRVSGLPKEVEARVGDAGRAQDVTALAAGQDLVITATRPAPGQEPELVATLRSLLSGLANTGVRLLVVGGAGSLVVPGRGGTLVADDPAFVPAEWRAIALACCEQYEVCRAATDVDWTYLSPPALLVPGKRTGAYRVGRDELLIDAKGTSAISMEDFAVALLDEAELPRYRCARFTVAY